MVDSSVLTIATDKSYYLQLAFNLARSFLHWHKGENAVPFYLATDREEKVPDDLRDKIEVISIRPNHLGDGFSSKLHIDQLVRTQHTLFIDADCLIYGSLQPVFNRFRGHDVSVIGEIVRDGDFFGDIAQIRQRLNLDYLIRFIGAIYYVESTDIARRVFERARELKPHYDELGLIRLRGKENEEPLLSIAMATHGLKPVCDDGDVKADAMCYTKIKTSVLKGVAVLQNSPNRFPSWATLTKAQPVIVHYNCAYSETTEYRMESLKLTKVFRDNWNELAANVLSVVTVLIPGAVHTSFKNLFRPLYRRIFGFRRIQKSKRM